MQSSAILYPMFALVAWSFLMAIWMIGTAYKAVNAGLELRYFRFGDSMEPPAYMRSAYQHYNNLFEMPVLFYTASLTAYVTAAQDALLLGLGWSYVAARVVHSLFHLSNRNIPRRRDSFFVSAALLIAIWVVLLIRVATGT